MKMLKGKLIRCMSIDLLDLWRLWDKIILRSPLKDECKYLYCYYSYTFINIMLLFT